jgi:hypothetical protein
MTEADLAKWEARLTRWEAFLTEWEALLVECSEGLRVVAVAELDLLNRHEVTMMRFAHLGPAQDEMASVNAQRTSVRGWLGKMRDVETRMAAKPDAS